MATDSSFECIAPDIKLGWEEEFIVPSQFSEQIMATLSSGNMTRSARVEIIQITLSKKKSWINTLVKSNTKRLQEKIFFMPSKEKGDTLGYVYVSCCV